MNLLTILLQADAEASGNIFQGPMGTIIMMVALFAIMYFFMIRPQQKKQKAMQEARNSIKSGDKIVTAGGLHGKVKEVGDTYFVIEVAEGVKIKIEKGSVFASPEQIQKN